MGCCTKEKIRSANDQHARNPASTPTTDTMIRFLSSSRWARRGIGCVGCVRAKAVVSDMESLSDYVHRSFLTGHYLNGGRQIPCAVRFHATEEAKHPQHELCAHPPPPMFEPKPLRRNVCAGRDDDIE